MRLVLKKRDKNVLIQKEVRIIIKEGEEVGNTLKEAVPSYTLDLVLRGTYGGSSLLCNIGLCLSNYKASLSGYLYPSLRF